MADESAEREPEPKLLGTWITLQQAELMFQHVREAGSSWPDVAIYMHSCITAIRSVTLTMQKALAHEAGFDEWYSKAQETLAADPEMKYLVEARNHILKRGNLQLQHAYGVSYTGELPISVHGIGPDGPDVRIPNPDNPDERVPVDWRKLKGFKFNIPLRFAAIDGLPDPPEREAKELLEEKIAWLRLLILDAEERFDAVCFDPEEAAEQRKMLGSLRPSGPDPQS